MKRNFDKLAGLGALLMIQLAGSEAMAGSLTLPNSFSADTPAVAAEVNGNFSAVKRAVDDNDRRVAALETTLTALQNRLQTLEKENVALQSALSIQATTLAGLETADANQASAIADLESLSADQAVTIADLETLSADQAATIAGLESQLAVIDASQVMALENYLTVDEVSDSRGPLVRFSGVNLQLVNGLGRTDSVNGLGNLIVGYDEAHYGSAVCTRGVNESTHRPVTDEASCIEANGEWTVSGFKTGSHYLVTGSLNNYSFWGGVLAGVGNTSNYHYASVSGGRANIASNETASVCGGRWNIARGQNSSVSGGEYNVAEGTSSSVSGGSYNTASAWKSSVNGGEYNTASAWASTVSGGAYNIASGIAASISGGGDGTATGGNRASADYSTILGDTRQGTAVPSQTIPPTP